MRDVLRDRLENETWTCPWCDSTVRATDRCKLRKKRAKHLSYHHPERDDGSKSARYPPVETSNLPLDQRNWTCPFCLEGLPLLGKAAHDKAVTHHYKTRHKRRKITKKTVARARYKQYKTNPALGRNPLEQEYLAYEIEQIAYGLYLHQVSSR